MRTVIFRTMAPWLTALILMFSVFITLRGHNLPGGGFIGGLVAASALAMLGMAHGVSRTRTAIHFHPLSYAAFGLGIATLSAVLAAFAGRPFMTGLWLEFELFGVDIALSTPLLFDIGVYLVVAGAMTAITLGLEERDPPELL